MRVIISGAGQVGYNIARYIASPETHVTLIDKNRDLITKATETLDVRGVVGHAASPDVLDEAGAADADMLIAVTQVDEVNMMACQVAHSLFNVQTKIARVRDKSFLSSRWAGLFSRDNLPIDRIISPEQEVAEAIHRRLEVPGAFDVINFVGGRIRLIGVAVLDDTAMTGHPLRKLADLFTDLHATIVLVVRDNKVETTNKDTVLQVGDEIYAVVDQDHLKRFLSLYGHEEDESRRVLVLGAGNIGAQLAEKLEADHIRVKLVESNKERAEAVAEQLQRSVVLHGDALDSDILTEASSTTETVVAVTNDDEVNILAALLAKRAGCLRVVSLVNKNAYGSLIGQLGIDTVVSPRSITVSSILQYIRRGRVRAVHSLPNTMGEVFELQALETSKIVGKTLRSAGLPRRVLIGGIMRDETFILPRADTVIEAGDLVVVFAEPDQVKKVERLFSVHLEFF